MSKPNTRGSLIGLKTTLPAMPKVAPVALTPEMEERILGTDNFTSLRTGSLTDGDKDVYKEASPAASGAAVALYPPPGARNKEPTVLMNAKLPARLHARLKRTAQFNDISMTDILIRAIEAELSTGRYTAPPDTWGSDTA
jgi:hypothetical protein